MASTRDVASPVAKKNLSVTAWLICVLTVAALLRLPLLSHVPPALNQDEASFGYNAWALWQTGADRNGESWPFFMLSFGPGDYPSAISSYLTIPFVAVLGPTPTAFRLPTAISGVFTVLIGFVWLRRRIGDGAALIAAGALSIDPWHVALTRTALEGAYAPLLLALAMLGLDRAGMLASMPRPADEDRIKEQTDGFVRCGSWALLAGVMLSLHAWLYSATRMFTPLLVVAILLTQTNHLLGLVRASAGRLILLYGALGLALGGWPLWWTALRHPEQLTARVSATLIDFTGPPLIEVTKQLFSNYLTYMDPRLWFFAARDIVGTPLPGLGQHLWVAAPLMLIGLASAVRRFRRDAWCRFVIAWFVIAPLPAVICREDHPHSLRTVGGVLLWAVLAGMGAKAVETVWRRWVITGVAAVVLNTAYFAQRYFVAYPPRAEAGFQATLYSAMQRAFALAPGADFILTTGRANQAFIYALLIEPIQPRRLASVHLVKEDAPGNFHQVLRVGRWYFAPTDPANFPQASRRFEAEWNALPSDSKGLVITTPGVFTGGALIETVVCRSGQWEDGYEIRAVAFGPS